MRGRSWRRREGMPMLKIVMNWRNKLVRLLIMVILYRWELLMVATELTPAVDRYLMEILVEHDVDFIVAPVSAKAQVCLLTIFLTVAHLFCQSSHIEFYRLHLQRR